MVYVCVCVSVCMCTLKEIHAVTYPFIVNKLEARYTKLHISTVR